MHTHQEKLFPCSIMGLPCVDFLFSLSSAIKGVTNISSLDKLVHEPVEGNAWHADHVVPVYKGGGECTLENMRTLCVACHSEVTKAQRAERCLMRMRAKNLLKIAMKELENGSNIKPAKPIDVSGQKEVAAEPVEGSPLFIKVPGSAYSRKKNNIADIQEQECSPSR